MERFFLEREYARFREQNHIYRSRETNDFYRPNERENYKKKVLYVPPDPCIKIWDICPPIDSPLGFNGLESR